MEKCNICGTTPKQIGSMEIKTNNGEDNLTETPLYDRTTFTMIKGQRICNECMDIYHKIFALCHDIDFSCGSQYYYADGHNLKRGGRMNEDI